MALNVKKLRGLQKDISKKAGDGNDLFVYANKLGEEEDIRILPPLPKMQGVYFAEQIQWWINGKPYLSNETFDEECVIAQIIDEAREAKDAELDALLDAKKNGMPTIKREVRYLIPILHLDCKYDEDTDELTDWKIKDDAGKVLVAKPTLMKAINAVVTARPYQNGTEDGIADRVEGYNLIVGKTGKGLNTEYTAMGWNEKLEMPEKLYTEKAIPDVMKLTLDNRKSDEYLESVIRNYLYGDEIIEDTNAKKKDDEAEEKAPAKKDTTRRKPAAKKTAEKKPARPKRGATKKKSLLDDAAEYSADDDELGDLD